MQVTASTEELSKPSSFTAFSTAVLRFETPASSPRFLHGEWYTLAFHVSIETLLPSRRARCGREREKARAFDSARGKRCSTKRGSDFDIERPRRDSRWTRGMISFGGLLRSLIAQFLVEGCEDVTQRLAAISDLTPLIARFLCFFRVFEDGHDRCQNRLASSLSLSSRQNQE